MADDKYKAGTVPLNTEQMAVVEKAMDMFTEQNGVRLSRSQMLTALAHWYVRKNGEVK